MIKLLPLLKEIRIDPFPIKGHKDNIDNYIHITKIGNVDLYVYDIYEDNQIIIAINKSLHEFESNIEHLETALKNAKIKYRAKEYDEEIDYFIPSRYVDKQSLNENISPKSFIAPKTIDYYQKLLNQSRLSSQSRNFVQQVMNSIKKSGNWASSNQVSILSKFREGNIQ